MKRTTLIGLGTLLIGNIAISARGWDSITLFRAAMAENTAAVSGLVLPKLSPGRGKELFTAKGCVVCHSINGVGGSDAAPLDASTMDPAMNPFEFFARMLAGMTPMLTMQRDRLGHEVELTAGELGDVVAFIHDEATQKSLSTKDIPEDMKRLME
jgi:mono/diheme cytochrome c family protein